MRKRLTIIGITLLFIGLITISLYNVPAEKYVLEQIYQQSYAWRVSGYFEKNDRLSVGIVPNDGWGIVADTPMPQIGMGIKGINLTVEVISPKNGSAVFNLTLIVPPNRNPNEFPPKVVAWGAYLISKTDEFIINEDTPPLCVVVNETGIYTAYIADEEWLSKLKLPPEKTTAPKEIKLARETLVVTYPYRNLFTVASGATLIVLGTSVTVVSKRDKSGKERNLKKRMKT